MKTKTRKMKQKGTRRKAAKRGAPAGGRMDQTIQAMQVQERELAGKLDLIRASIKTAKKLAKIITPANETVLLRAFNPGGSLAVPSSPSPGLAPFPAPGSPRGGGIKAAVAQIVIAAGRPLRHSEVLAATRGMGLTFVNSSVSSALNALKRDGRVQRTELGWVRR